MTKEKIFEIIERAFERELHWEEKATDELFELIEQEKKGIAREILDDLKGLLEGYIHTNENTTLYEYYRKKYGVKS